jgi:hypothetical protein
MPQCIVRIGEEFVFALHPDAQLLTGLYEAQTVDGPAGPVTLPAGELVPVPRDFVYAYDELGRRKDPRRWAGDGSSPLG